MIIAGKLQTKNQTMVKFNKTLILFLFFLFLLDILVWRTIWRGVSQNPEIYFLSVGQGDSELAVLPGGVQILIDAGGNNRVLRELASILPFSDRYLDLVMLSHPEPDHFLGLIDVLKNYHIGAFIFNGRDGVSDAWPILLEIIKENKIKTAVLSAGDKIRRGEIYFDILAPTTEMLKQKNQNESCLVLELNAADRKILFTGDSGVKTENFLLQNLRTKIDILKVSHHGSKYSTTEKFLAALQPSFAFIEVGKNGYGHPTPEVLSRLAAIGAKIFRTDTDKTIKVSLTLEGIKVFKKP